MRFMFLPLDIGIIGGPDGPTSVIASGSDSAVASMMNNNMTVGDKLANVGEMMLLGMGTVFVALAIIWGILELFNKIFNKNGKKGGKASAEAAPAEIIPEPAIEPDITDVPDVPAAETDDAAIVAAITAAIAAYTDAPASSFRVVAFKRSSKTPGWIKSGDGDR